MPDPTLFDECSPWIHIDLGYWKPLTDGQPPSFFRKKSIVYHQEDSPEYVYIVKSGRVRVTSYQPDGAEKQIYIAEKGAMFGESSIIGRRPQTDTAIAIVDSFIYCIPIGKVEKVMSTDWELTQRIIQLICRKNHILFKQVLELSFAQSLQRVAKILLNIGKQYGKLSGDKIVISIKFTHQDVASMINTSRVTVSNIFNVLSEKGIISKKNGYFSLNHIETLISIADGDLYDIHQVPCR